MPFVGIERGQKIVEVAGARVEIDLVGDLRDQAIDFLGMLLDE